MKSLLCAIGLSIIVFNVIGQTVTTTPVVVNGPIFHYQAGQKPTPVYFNGKDVYGWSAPGNEGIYYWTIPSAVQSGPVTWSTYNWWFQNE